MRVQVVDPSAFTPPYDHALCVALARAGASVELVTSRFVYGEVPAPDGYRVTELFYRHARGAPGSPARRLSKLAEHVPDMVRLRRAAAPADVVHLQWLTAPLVDVHLLPDRPLVLTAHDVLPREPRPGQLRAQRRVFGRVDAIVVHSEYGRRQLVDGLGLPADTVHVIHHGAFEHVAGAPRSALPAELARADRGDPVVLFLGLLRPYKGLDTLLRAWPQVEGAQLWIVGRPMMALEPLQALGTPGVRWVPRFVGEGEVAALLERADVVVLPYSRTERFDQSGVLASALAVGTPSVLTDIGGFSEVAATGAARLVPPGDPEALGAALAALVADAEARSAMASAARAAARGPYSWERSARETLALYESIRRR
jgi:glycosyltransferase involved in cell wall biosynthesis